MTAIRIQDFKGTAPRQSPRLLGPSQAQTALDARLFQREVQTYTGLLAVGTAFNGINTKTIYRYVDNGVGYFFDWATAVNVARVPVTGDTKNRVFYTGDGVPKKTGNDIAIPISSAGPQSWYNMGVKNPATKPTASVSAGGAGAVRATAYVITYVTGWGEESGPSPASAILTTADGGTITVTRAADTPAAAYNITAWNVYRLITGANGVASYFYVGQQATFATTTFSDTVPDATAVLQGSFPSSNQVNFVEPPSDLTGLTAMPNGVLTGFSPSLKQQCFSEPYFPYAWPTNYRRGIVFDPVACAAYGNMAVTGTTGKPATFTGNDPTSIQGNSLLPLQSCQSAQGLAETPFGVVWPSPDGLILATDQATSQIITRQLYDKKKWQAVLPASLQAAVYDGRYYASIGAGSQVLVLDPNEPDDALTFLNVQVQAILSDWNADGLYVCINGTIYKWDGDGTQYRAFDWRSKVFTEETYSNLAWVRCLFTIPIFGGLAYGDLTSYNALRTTLLAENATENYAGYGGSALGMSAFGMQPFGMDDFIDIPPDITVAAPDGQTTALYINVYGDGLLKAQVSVPQSGVAVHIPGGYLAREWELEAIGKVNLQEMAAASTMDELQKIN